MLITVHVLSRAKGLKILKILNKKAKFKMRMHHGAENKKQRATYCIADLTNFVVTSKIVSYQFRTQFPINTKRFLGSMFISNITLTKIVYGRTNR